MNFVFYNESIIPEDRLFLKSSNRSFRYGDGLFETIFISGQIPLYIELHTDRLLRGMKMLQLETPANLNISFFKNAIADLLRENNYVNARCRITAWRGGEGWYLPTTNKAEILIELFPSGKGDYQINTNGIHLGVYDLVPKLIHPVSAFKTANSLVYVLAAKFAYEQHIDDVIILNQEGRIADTIHSNLFFYRGKKLFTPATTEGGVDGVMRKVIAALCRKEGIEVNEVHMNLNELDSAEEVFLTNVIDGVKWVGSFKNNHYKNQFAADLIHILNEQKNNNSLVSP